jgi:hypothetical protein
LKNKINKKVKGYFNKKRFGTIGPKEKHWALMGLEG